MTPLHIGRPCSEFSDEQHIALFKEGRVRYTRKHHGPTCVARHDEMGWHLSCDGIDVTDKHPVHVTKLMFSLLPVGTTLIGEMAVVRPGLRCVADDVNATALMQKTFGKDYATLVKTGRLHEPVFFVHDALEWEGESTDAKTYDERQALLRDITLFGGDYIQPVEKGIGINPLNWRDVISHFSWAGVFMHDGRSTNVETGCFELIVEPTEFALVVAAVKCGSAQRPSSLVVAQRRATDGTWFCRGTIECTDVAWKPVNGSLKRLKVPIIHDSERSALDSLMRLGKGVVVELGASGAPQLVFKGLRKDKRPDDCVALRRG